MVFARTVLFGAEPRFVRIVWSGRPERYRCCGRRMRSSLLDETRQRFPLGDRITGRVSRVSQPGMISALVDLDRGGEGFIDVLHLPHDPGRWPIVGDGIDV